MSCGRQGGGTRGGVLGCLGCCRIGRRRTNRPSSGQGLGEASRRENANPIPHEISHWPRPRRDQAKAKSAESWTRFVETRPMLVEIGKYMAEHGPNLAVLVGRNLPNLAEDGHWFAKVGPTLPEISQIWSTMAQSRPASTPNLPKSAHVGRGSHRAGQTWPRSAKVGPRSLKVGRNRPNVGRRR